MPALKLTRCTYDDEERCIDHKESAIERFDEYSDCLARRNEIVARLKSEYGKRAEVFDLEYGPEESRTHVDIRATDSETVVGSFRIDYAR